MAKTRTVEEIREVVGAAWTADADNREQARLDREYLAGRQWTAQEKAARDATERPMLTFNRLPVFVRQVVNDIRQNRPSIKVVPDGEEEDGNDLSEVYNGLIRQIEYRANGNVYAAAAADAVISGIGFFRVGTDYVDDRSFDQEIRLEHIADPSCVLVDPKAVLADRSDAGWIGVIERMDKAEFEQRWPGKTIESFDAAGDLSESALAFSWSDGTEWVHVCEFWEKVPVRKYLIGDGMQSQFVDAATYRQGLAAGYQGRVVDAHDVYVTIVSGNDVLERSLPFQVPHIPIVAVLGEEVRIGGEAVRSGVIRHARDPQKLYNYWRTTSAEVITQAPRSVWVVTRRMIDKFRAKWGSLNRAPVPYIEYEPDPDVPGGRPMRERPPDPPSALWTEAQMVVDDLKSTTGIFDASLGARGNETSGVAIKTRQAEGDNANYHFTDNLKTSMEQAGRIVIDLVPLVYDSERVLRLIGDDDEERAVRVNQPAVDQYGQETILNDLSRGKYTVRVTTGPSYASKREQSVDVLMQLMQSAPQVAQVAADLIVKNMDLPGGEVLVERLRRMMPPELLAGENEQQEEPQPAPGMIPPGMPQDGPQQPMQGPPPQEGLDEEMRQIALRRGNAEAELAELKQEEQALKNMRLMAELGIGNGAANGQMNGERM